MLVLPQSSSILKNPGKTVVLTVLPIMVTLDTQWLCYNDSNRLKTGKSHLCALGQNCAKLAIVPMHSTFPYVAAVSWNEVNWGVSPPLLLLFPTEKCLCAALVIIFAFQVFCPARSLITDVKGPAKSRNPCSHYFHPQLSSWLDSWSLDTGPQQDKSKSFAQSFSVK